MRKSILIIEELKDIEKIISTANMLLKQIPDDYVVSSSLQDAEARQKMLISELKEAIVAERKHCVQFVIKNFDKYAAIPLNRFFESVCSLQDLIKEISQTMFHQRKDLFSLSFATTFPSSFGVMLETSFQDNELISKSYQSLESVFDIFAALNEDESTFITLKTRLKDRRLLAKFRKFYQIQANYTNDIDLVWGDVFQNNFHVSLKKERISYLADILSKYENTEDENRDIECVVKGISLRHKKAELYCNGRYKDAKAPDEALFRLVNYLDKSLKLQVKISRRINESTDEIEEFWEVI